MNLLFRYSEIYFFHNKKPLPKRGFQAGENLEEIQVSLSFFLYSNVFIGIKVLHAVRRAIRTPAIEEVKLLEES